MRKGRRRHHAVCSPYCFNAVALFLTHAARYAQRSANGSENADYNLNHGFPSFFLHCFFSDGLLVIIF